MVARALARARVTPNQISILSIFFACVAGCSLSVAGERIGGSVSIWLLVAAAGIQLRLLCNLLDGLLAIERGLKSKTGDLFNEMPDRAADILILLGAGVAVHEQYEWGLTLGVAATILAILTAYVRLLGGSLGFSQDFRGPMAKQHRMFVLTVGCLAAAVENWLIATVWSLVVALAVVAIGCVVTLWRRTRRIAAQLNAR
jgi:phosphatidylglycerophosphate synthase